MATYKGIQGYSVQTLSSDPSPTASVEGQLWYNSTSGSYKIAIAAGGAWSAGNNLNLGKGEMGSAQSGTQSACMIFGGDAPPGTSPPGYLDETEQYDGTSWTEVADLNLGRSMVGGLGTNTAAMCVAGNYPTDTNYDEIWDGTSWAETANTLAARAGGAAAGTTTAALMCGGTWNPTGGRMTNCETWNGTSWTEGNNILVATTYFGMVGSTTAALMYSGNIAGGALITDETATYNGTSWTEVNDLNTARNSAGKFGTVTAAICVGGTLNPGDQKITEQYNGTSWSEVGDLTTARVNMGNAGTTALGLAAGGNPGYLTATEEWGDPTYSVKTVTTS